MKTFNVNQKINLKSHTSKRELKSGLLPLYAFAERNYNSGIDYQGDAKWDMPLQLSDIQSASCFEKRYIHN